MENLNVKIEHIYHSCFTVETKNHFLVFDYFKGDIELRNKKTYVFVTHGHEDHYTPKIFNWKGNNVKYILSSDITVDNIDANINILSPNEILEFDDIDVKAFGSTDLGLSLLITVDNMTIFHAGDLNWWYWNNDSLEEKQEMELAFKSEIAEIKGEEIDIAFFPVDPRLEENYHLGGEYFIKEIKPEYFIPMHFGDKFQTSTEFIHKIRNSPSTIVEITKPNQLIEL